MKLKSLSLSDVEQVRQWRNEQIEMLRTPFLLTQEQQVNFYHEVICSRQANARYWGICVDGEKFSLKQAPDGTGFLDKEILDKFIGMCGLENISWENRLAEISLILDPEYPMDKYGEEAVRLLLHEGFMNMNLENIFTEVYDCSPNQQFWIDSYIQHRGNDIPMITLPSRKYWNGKYYDSLYINFNKERYNENSIS